MRFDEQFGFDMTRDREPEATIVVLVDRRGRRMLVPVGGRLRRLAHNAIASAKSAHTSAIDFTSGTIH
jgi:hypothetical protein